MDYKTSGVGVTWEPGVILGLSQNPVDSQIVDLNPSDCRRCADTYLHIWERILDISNAPRFEIVQRRSTNR